MQHLKEGAELVEGRMTFLQDFLQKKYAFGILFFVIIILGFITAVSFFNKGVETGSESSKKRIESLEFSLKNIRYSDSIEIKSLHSRVQYYKKSLDTCNNSSMNGNLEILVTKKLEEAERIKRILERKIVADQKDIKTIDNIIKN